MVVVVANCPLFGGYKMVVVVTVYNSDDAYYWLVWLLIIEVAVALKWVVLFIGSYGHSAKVS